MSDPDPLRAAIDATTGHSRSFAQLIGCDERTVRRWLAGERKTPGPVLALCRIYAAHPELVRPTEPAP